MATTAEQSYQAERAGILSSPPGVRTSRSLELVDRLGIARYTILLTAVGVAASAAICLTAYALIGFDPRAEPISIILPILCPLLIVPPMTVRAKRAALMLREQQAHIAEQNIALERILTEKDRILTLVGHDLRGQLNLVMGFAQIISRQAEDIPPDRLADYANEIHQAGKKTNEVLTDLLNWGRARAGQLPSGTHFEPFNDILRDVIANLEREIEHKEIGLELPQPDLADEVDQVIVSSALRNVLGNAIKFSHRGGRIEIAASRQGSDLRFTIRDFGIGISPDQLARLRGGHLVSSTEGTSREAGSGLGLAICRDVIEAQGGALEIESTQGKGTSVDVTLPIPD